MILAYIVLAVFIIIFLMLVYLWYQVETISLSQDDWEEFDDEEEN